MHLRTIEIADLPAGQPIRVEVDGRAVLLVLLEGIPHAMSDICPHRGASLAEGILRADCITCPAHLWRFSVRDGTKQSDPRIAIPTYPCWIEDGWVLIDLPPLAPTLSMRQALLAHARQAREVGQAKCGGSDG